MSQYVQGIAPTIKPNRAHFNMSSRHATTIDFDYLYPIFWEEVLPGDTFTMDTDMFGRFATLLHPLMDNAYLDIHYFFAPTRILWDNARRFYGEQTDPGDSIDFTIPTMAATAVTGYSELSIHDYLGLPTKIPDYEHISLLHRLYNFCYNEFYRDQNLQDSVVVDTDNGPDSPTDYVLLKRGKRHDYVTSGIPNLLKDPATAQTLPLGTSADIKYGDAITGADLTGNWMITKTDGSSVFTTRYGASKGVDSGQQAATTRYNMVADLSNATAATIAQLRQAVQIQALLELDARAGTRYPEQLYAVYGVQYTGESYRPEYLGGGSTRIDISQVPQTSNDGTNGDVGDLGAYGTFGMSNVGFSKSFQEPGYIIGIISARADITYQQGLDRKMSRTDRYSYFHPLLQNIGDQATLKQEIVCQDPATDTGSTGTPDNERTFNYQERYAEYKYRKNMVTGLFRSNATASLESWHLSEEFTAAEPNFNAAFIQQNTPVDRAIATASEPHLILDIQFNLQAARPMHMYSIPGFGSRL
jgi:hypothetical protein